MILKLKSPIIPLQSLMKICCCRHPTSVPLNLKSIENWDRNEAISLLDDRRRAVKVVCLNQFCHWIDPSAHPIIACRPPPSKRNNRWPNARRIIHFGSNFVRSFYHIAISLLFIICLFFSMFLTCAITLSNLFLSVASDVMRPSTWVWICFYVAWLLAFSAQQRAWFSAHCRCGI